MPTKITVHADKIVTSEGAEHPINDVDSAIRSSAKLCKLIHESKDEISVVFAEGSVTPLTALVLGSLLPMIAKAESSSPHNLKIAFIDDTKEDGVNDEPTALFYHYCIIARLIEMKAHDPIRALFATAGIIASSDDD